MVNSRPSRRTVRVGRSVPLPVTTPPCAGEAVRQQRRGGLGVDFHRGQAAYLVTQPVGGRAGARADLEHVRAEVNVARQGGQYLVLEAGRPFGAGAQLGMLFVHSPEVMEVTCQANGVSCQAVLQDGHCDGWPARPTAATAVAVRGTFPMPAGRVFDWHTHDDHQVAWAASGVLTVRTAGSAWVLPPTRALWIPAGVRHETLSAGIATMRTLYVRPDRCPISWTEPTPVSAGPLLCELIGYLEDRGLDAEQRARAEAVLVDLLRPVAMTAIEMRWPRRNGPGR